MIGGKLGRVIEERARSDGDGQTERNSEVMKLFLVVLALVAFLLFCRGQGYEWTLGTDDEVKLIQARIAAQWSCFGRYDGTKEYDRVLRCQADAEKLIRDKFKWW